MNLFNLFCKIALDDSDYQKGLDAAKKGTKSFAHEAGDKISDFAKKAENALKTAAKIGAAALGAVSTGVGFLVKSAVQEYADYEQLVGGVDTLFKDASAKVQEYAANAYKTAGLSANEYMETVTSFSASLLQSLGGDTAAAAEKADRAITDMSDNANKMGTDMTAIQNAYQGFAKQNYTMLDNLKLGYGGTQQEMQRLIDDANALNAAQGKLTNYSIESYADIVDAIHDVQTSMGITGTTAKEAATTIQGSVNSAKSAWHNLMIGIADDNQDFETLVNNFVDSVYTAADNILPRVETSLDGILQLIQVASEKIIPRVISTVAEKAPALIEAASDIILALVDGITDNLDRIFDAVDKTAKRVVPKISKAFADLVPKIAKSATSIINQIDGAAIAVGGLYTSFKGLLSGNWISVGIGLITTAFGLSKKATDLQRDAVYNLTDAEKDLLQASDDVRDSFERVKDTRNDGIAAIENETKQTKDLWQELQTLAHENGKVDDSNHDRADYILGRLNDALGTEYSMNGDIIEQYQEMQKEIDNLIQKKQAEMLIENDNEAYTNALKQKDDAIAAITVAQKEVENAQAELDEALARRDVATYSTPGELSVAAQDIINKQNLVKEAKQDYQEAVNAASTALSTINTHEEALALAQQGRYSDSIALLTKDTAYRWSRVNDLQKLSEKEKMQLKTDLEAQKKAVETFRALVDKKTPGFTTAMLSEMESTLAKLQGYWDDATYGALAGGQNIGKALEEGLQSATAGVIGAASSAVSSVNSIIASIAGTSGRNYYGQSPNEYYKGRSLRTEQYSGNPINFNITIHAETNDIGVKIASEVQSVVMKALQASGNAYRGGRTSYAY